MKIFLSVAGAMMVTIILVWGVCFAAHFSFENGEAAKFKTVYDEANQKADSDKDVPEDAIVDLRVAQDALVELHKAKQSSLDPFWFTHS